MKKVFLIIGIIFCLFTSCVNLSNRKQELLDNEQLEADLQREEDSIQNFRDSIDKIEEYYRNHPINITLELQSGSSIANENITVQNNKIKNINYIQSVSVDNYRILYNTEGFVLTNNINTSFNRIEQRIVDSLIIRRDVSVSYQLFENDVPVKSISNFKFIKSDFFEDVFNDNNLNIFVPYAVLNLSTGNHILSAKIKVKYKNVLNQELTIDNVTFNKPNTKTASIVLNNLAVNCENKGWDVSFFGNTLPDISAKLYIGDFNFWEHFEEDTPSISTNKPAKIIIGENDDIRIVVEDIDIMAPDFISSFYLKTKNLKRNEQYIDSIPCEEIKSCKITYKVE